VKDKLILEEKKMVAFEQRKQRDQNKKFKKQVSVLQKKDSSKDDETATPSSSNKRAAHGSPQGQSLKRKRMVIKKIILNLYFTSLVVMIFLRTNCILFIG